MTTNTIAIYIVGIAAVFYVAAIVWVSVQQHKLRKKMEQARRETDAELRAARSEVKPKEPAWWVFAGSIVDNSSKKTTRFYHDMANNRDMTEEVPYIVPYSERDYAAERRCRELNEESYREFIASNEAEQ